METAAIFLACGLLIILIGVIAMSTTALLAAVSDLETAVAAIPPVSTSDDQAGIDEATSRIQAVTAHVTALNTAPNPIDPNAPNQAA